MPFIHANSSIQIPYEPKHATAHPSLNEPQAKPELYWPDKMGR